MLQISNHFPSHMRVHSLRFEISHHIQAYFVWMYLNLVYQLELLVYDKLRTCALVFHFFDFFFEYFVIISNLVKAKFDQHLNKFYTPNWKSKPGSFLVTPKWRFGEVLDNFMLQISNHLSSHMRVQMSSKGSVNGSISKQDFFPPSLNQPNNYPTHLLYI